MPKKKKEKEKKKKKGKVKEQKNIFIYSNKQYFNYKSNK